MDDKLTVQPKVLFNPEKDTTKASRAAKMLIDIVKQNGWAKNFGGQKDHLFYEAWQTVGKYYNVSVATKDAEPVDIGGITGFKAIGYVIDNKTGVEVGHAEAYCMRDEGNWKSKPTFQLASMAQTRAGSKSLRQMFGFVVALAGFSPTPAEEMTGQDPDWIKDGDKKSIIYASQKQIEFITKLLSQKGYTEKDLKSKYNVEKKEDLSATQASQIIENLLKLPNAIIAEDAEPEINNDEVEAGMEAQA